MSDQAVQSVRRRERRPRRDWEHRIHIRFYCPACGEVRGPSKSTPLDTGHNGRVIRNKDGTQAVAGDLVYPHFRPFFLGSDKCPGGRIDPVKDRAP